MLKISSFFILILLFANKAYSQSGLPNDCVNAINICDNQNIGMKVKTGVGIQECADTNCGGNGEHNSLWLRVTIGQSGTFGFEITPGSSAITEDYDFWVYGPNAVCGSLGSPIRCSTTNPNNAKLPYNTTGMNATEIDFSEGPGANGNGYVQWLNVTAGEVYYIVIDLAIGVNNSFSLQWTGTAKLQNPFDLVNFDDFPVKNLCDNDKNLFESFDLSTLTSDFMGTHNDFSLSYFASQNDAFLNINPITAPTMNIVGINTYYARIQHNASSCFELRPITIIVSPPTAKPIISYTTN